MKLSSISREQTWYSSAVSPTVTVNDTGGVVLGLAGEQLSTLESSSVPPKTQAFTKVVGFHWKLSHGPSPLPGRNQGRGRGICSQEI